MLVLLPPSETKASGGDGTPLDLEGLSFPELNPVRRKLAGALVDLAGDVPASMAALGLSERQEAEVARNAALFQSPTMPALRRYTGVLFDALGFGSFTRAEARRAGGRLAVASALFGVVRAGDPIPAYRCSGDSVLPGVGSLRELWRPVLEPALAAEDPLAGSSIGTEHPLAGSSINAAELVVDLRSGTYANLAKLPTAVTVQVVSERGGRRTTVSHHNKAYKGQLARALAVTQREPATVAAVLRVARAAGLVVEQTGDRALELITE